ncbi:hypothetical protein MRX96_009257 [Rhipicephalus microplus]
MTPVTRDTAARRKDDTADVGEGRTRHRSSAPVVRGATRPARAFPPKKRGSGETRKKGASQTASPKSIRAPSQVDLRVVHRAVFSRWRGDHRRLVVVVRFWSERECRGRVLGTSAPHGNGGGG